MPGIYGGYVKAGKGKLDGQKMFQSEYSQLTTLQTDYCHLGCLSFKDNNNEVIEDSDYAVTFFGETFGHIDDVLNTVEGNRISSARELLTFISERGIKSVEKLNGVFVTAIYEKKKHRLTIYNDRFGLYPLYYTTTEGGNFYFSQDVRLLRQVMELKPDYTGIAEYLSFDYCLEDRSFFQDVKYIMPAQKLEFQDGKLAVNTYWTLPQSDGKRKKRKKEYLRELHNIYTDAVLRRKSDSVNIIGLTGGFDSRLILAILDGEEISSYNYGNAGSGDNVGGQALAEVYHTKHHYLQFEDLDFASTAREIVSRSDGQCPFERFYQANAAKEKAKVKGGIEISGMGGDAVSGQKSNFTGLFPNMGGNMTVRKKNYYRKRLLNDITRGRMTVNRTDIYGPLMTQEWENVVKEYNRAVDIAEAGQTFGNYTMRLKLRTLERRVTMSSMWIVNQHLSIRFPVYDYRVMNFFNTVPQTYRFGQRLYIRMIQDYYPKAAKCPHSETGKPVRESHCVMVDFITVKDYLLGKFGLKKSVYSNSFGFVNDAIRACNNLDGLVTHQKPTPKGIFNISKYGSVETIIDKARHGDNAALKILKNIIQISLLNELYFDNQIEMYYEENQQKEGR